ncbi:peptidase family M48-domain-containing protein [Phycomyces nitens]|nr:peptidase family M48-domain-containing protein [Phycomyces nitens]
MDFSIIQPLLDGINYKAYVLGFSIIVYFFEQYLNFRQYRRYLLKERPSDLADIVSQEDFAKAQSYNLEKSQFGFIENAYKQAETIAMLGLDFLPFIWDFSGRLMLSVAGYGPEYEIVQSIVFTILFSTISTLTSMPFSLYSTFVIEQRHGFNKQTLGLFFMDAIKSHLIMVVIMVPFLGGFLRIIRSTGDNFYLYIWVAMLVFQFVMINLYPTLIQPLFNKLTPLEDGELKSKIEALAARIDFPLKKLYVIDGSKRSSHSNAYFYGFGKNKHIVLFDTLIEHSTEEEICAVLAHELGHWAMSHTLRILASSQMYLFLVFWLFSFAIHSEHLYRDFGFSTMPTLIGFLLFQFAFSPLDSVINFLMHVYQRKNEFEADAYALKLGYAATLRSALIKLSIKNLGGFNIDPWYSAWNHSHPSLTERLKALGVQPTSDTPITQEETKKEQ